METISKIHLGSAGATPLALLARMANRHGLVAGATGTGKTVTLQTLAEGFSRLGVPVFTADVKGDLSGIAAAGSASPRITERLAVTGPADWVPEGCPTLFWDIFGATGHPVRTTLSEMGPLLLANLLELNEIQAGVLQVAFSLADDQGLLLLDLKDLRALLGWMGEHRKEVETTYGSASSVSIGAILRALLVLEEAGGDRFFGEPALRIADLMRTDFSGRGVVSLLDGRKLLQQPRLYPTFLLWLLSELFEELPEVGDLDRPKLVFFFDEAHLLFDQAPKSLLEKVEQVVRLIRSKGVGVYFVTQNPDDVPPAVLGQLGNKVQHALRAFTPRDRKAIRAAAQSFRPNPALDTEAVLTELAVGEALVSVLDAKGTPLPVERALVAPPRSRLGALTEAERGERLQRSPLAGQYDAPVERESAYEVLQQRRRELAEQQEEAARTEASRVETTPPRHSSNRQSAAEAFGKSMLRTIGSTLGRQIVRGVLGTILGRRR